jgi:hypothetical protein
MTAVGRRHFQQLGPFVPDPNHPVEDLAQGRRIQTDLAAQEHQFRDVAVAFGHG